MAKAQLVPPVPAEQNILLELTHEEAVSLRELTARVGGTPETTRRRHTDAIARALEKVGVLHIYRGIKAEGNITFYE